MRQHVRITRIVAAVLAVAVPQVLGLDLLYTFDGDPVAGPAIDLLTTDAANNGTWGSVGAAEILESGAIFGSKALRFNGGTYLALPGTRNLGNAVTLAAHLKNIPAGGRRLFSTYNGGSLDGEMLFDFDPDGVFPTVTWGVRFAYDGLTVTSTMGNWAASETPHHLAVTWSNGTVKLYVDGAEVGQGTHATKTELVFKRGDIHLGEDYYGTTTAAETPLGILDDIVVLRTVLDPATIASLAANGATATFGETPPQNGAVYTMENDTEPLLTDKAPADGVQDASVWPWVVTAGGLFGAQAITAYDVGHFEGIAIPNTKSLGSEVTFAAQVKDVPGNVDEPRRLFSAYNGTKLLNGASQVVMNVAPEITGDMDPVGWWVTSEGAAVWPAQESNEFPAQVRVTDAGAPEPGPASGNWYVRMSRSGNNYAEIEAGLPTQTPGDVIHAECMVYVRTSAAYADFVMQLRPAAGATKALVTATVSASSSGNSVMVYDRVGKKYVNSTLNYTPGVWQKWEVDYTVGQNTFNLTVGGVAQNDIQTFNDSDPASPAVATFFVNAGAAGALSYVDDVLVRNTTTNTVLLQDGFEESDAVRFSYGSVLVRPLRSTLMNWTSGPHHVAATWADGLVKLYFDGLQVASGGQAGLGGIEMATNGLRFGEDQATPWLNEQFLGKADDILVLRRVMAPAEVANLASNGAASVLGSGGAGDILYTMESDSGVIVTDKLASAGAEDARLPAPADAQVVETTLMFGPKAWLGGAYGYFNGIELAGTSDLGSAVTLSAFLREVPQGSRRLYAVYDGGAVSGGEFVFDYDSDGVIDGTNPPVAIRFMYNGVTVPVTAGVLGGIVGNNGNWSLEAGNTARHHLAATYDAAEVKIYFDGVLVGSGSTLGTTPDTTLDFQIGATAKDLRFAGDHTNIRQSAVGYADDLFIVGRALNAGEIQALATIGAEAFLTYVTPDLDGDGDVDVEDMAAFVACGGRATVAIANPACETADLDGDNDVDPDDFGILQRCFTGSGAGVQLDCLQ